MLEHVYLNSSSDLKRKLEIVFTLKMLITTVGRIKLARNKRSIFIGYIKLDRALAHAH